MDVTVNKQFWMHCFGKDIPSAEKLAQQISNMEDKLAKMGVATTHREEQACKRIWNSLERKHKMLAAVKDGQPWAWYQYPSIEEYSTHH